MPHGQLIAARTRDAIVFTRTTRHADYTLTYWTACWRRSGRRTRVAITGESGPIASDSSTAGPLRFSGRFLAVPVTYSQVRYGDAGLELSVYDLATGSRFYTLYSRADYAPLLMEAVLLTPAGVVAYAYRDGMLPLRTRLVAWSGRRYSVDRIGLPRPLDDGPAGSITTPRLAGATLSWLHDGVPRSASLTRLAR